jgi:FkbM family methyltransferase
MNVLKKSFYTLLNVVTLGKGVPRKINNMIVRFPARWSRYYESNYEQENYSFLQQQLKPGMQVLDIGAHLGLFSGFSSQLVGKEGKIICFEPTPGTYSVLKETLRLNHCENVIAIQAAVSAAEGTASFYVSDTAACNSNSLVYNKPDRKLQSYVVQLVTIDGITIQYSLKPDLIKIDAEGAELDVLKGGGKTLTEYKPILILGLHPDFIKQKGDSLEAIWELLMKYQYQVQLDGKDLTKNDFCNKPLLFDVHCF